MFTVQSQCSSFAKTAFDCECSANTLQWHDIRIVNSDGRSKTK